MSNLHKAQPRDALIKMANEIARNVAPGQSQEQAAMATADHIVRFWARSLKIQIIDCLEVKNNQLHPTAIKAVELLKEMNR